jgi:solute carrier family 39 (zinc transporter), member 1/2/3
MLPSAFNSLSDPCLPDFWIKTYTAAPGAIAMSSAIIIFLVEFGSTRYLAHVDRQINQDDESKAGSSDLSVQERGSNKDNANREGHNAHFGHHHINPFAVEGELDTHMAATQKLGVAILEAGIIFHSVFIGLTLAVSTGSTFISLFITIIFHRTLPSTFSLHWN